MVGIDEMPLYLVAEEDPWAFDEEQMVPGVALAELLARLDPGQHLYLVDYASTPGRTRLTRLA